MKTRIAALSILLVTAFAFPAFAEEPAATPKPAAAKAVANVSKDPLTGKITYISDKKICVKPKGAPASSFFLITAETKVTVNGEAKAVTDIKKGWSGVVTPKADDITTAATVVITKTSGEKAAAGDVEEVVEVKLTPVK